MSRIRNLHAGWMKQPDYREAYEALEEEFALATALIRARAEAGLTQQLADRMGTKQEVVARWEGGKVLPSTRTLARLAKATGTTLSIAFTPIPRDGVGGKRSRKGGPCGPPLSVSALNAWIRSPCRPCRPCRRHPVASAGPSSPDARPPSPRWSPAGRRPRPHPATPSARPWWGR